MAAMSKAIPALMSGFNAQPPQGVNIKSHPPEDSDQLLGIDASGQYFLNKQPIRNETLAQAIKQIYDVRTVDKILYVQADKNLPYAKVIDAIDIVSHNGVRVTGMIDVLLVLLIIFMMIVPNARKAVDVQLPDPTPSTAPAAASNQIVLEINKDGSYAINKEPVAKANLATRLKQIYDPRPEKVIFVKGDPTVKFQQVIEAMDVARGSGVKVIGVPPKEAAQ